MSPPGNVPTVVLMADRVPDALLDFVLGPPDDYSAASFCDLGDCTLVPGHSGAHWSVWGGWDTEHSPSPESAWTHLESAHRETRTRGSRQ